ncbi:MAG: 7-cyano-7-deazaguanine synthase [Acidobacteriota bacterium]
MPSAEAIVLVSGGLDSAVLLAHEAEGRPVLPVYVGVGLAWEDAERAVLTRLLETPPFASALPLARLEFGMRDVYPPTHWAIQGTPPAYDTPDEDVYLTGRNLVLLTKAGVMAAASGARRIVLGPLAGNPFPDARPAFFSAMSAALSLGLDHAVEVVAPFLDWQKESVIARGVALGVPLDLTLSCMSPRPPGDGGRPGDGLPRHCGLCSKCRERRDAFAAAGVPDPTSYASPSPRGARS